MINNQWSCGLINSVILFKNNISIYISIAISILSSLVFPCPLNWDHHHTLVSRSTPMTFPTSSQSPISYYQICRNTIQKWFKMGVSITHQSLPISLRSTHSRWPLFSVSFHVASTHLEIGRFQNSSTETVLRLSFLITTSAVNGWFSKANPLIKFWPIIKKCSHIHRQTLS